MDFRCYFEVSRRIHAAIFASSLLIFVLVVGTVFTEAVVIMEPTGYSIFDFQRAWTKHRSDQILSAWIKILDVTVLTGIIFYTWPCSTKPWPSNFLGNIL